MFSLCSIILCICVLFLHKIKHMHGRTYTHTHTHVYVQTATRTHNQTQMHSHTCKCTYTHTHTRTHTIKQRYPSHAETDTNTLDFSPAFQTFLQLYQQRALTLPAQWLSSVQSFLFPYRHLVFIHSVHYTQDIYSQFSISCHFKIFRCVTSLSGSSPRRLSRLLHYIRDYRIVSCVDHESYDVW